MKEYQNIKEWLQKVTFQIGMKKFLYSKKFKILFHRDIIFVILIMKELLERFQKKKKKKNQKYEYLPKQKPLRGRVKVELDLYNYEANLT